MSHSTSSSCELDCESRLKVTYLKCITILVMESIVHALQRLKCSKARKVVRKPSNGEMKKGIPAWFMVIVEGDSIQYMSLDDKIFTSIASINEWRQYGPFEDVDWSIPSF